MRKVIVGLCGIVCACISCADSIVDDSFESYVVGSSLIGQGGWTSIANVTTATQGAWSIATNSPLGAAGSLAANVRDADTTALASPQLRKTYADTSSDFVVSYDFMASTFTQTPQFALQANNGAVSVIRLTMASSLKNRDGSSWDTLAALSVGTWYNFELITHFSSDSYDLVVSDSNGAIYTGKGLGLANTTTADTDRFNFGFNASAGASGGDYVVDNVTLSTNIIPSVTIGLFSMTSE